MAGTAVTLRTDLSLEQTRARLKAAIDHPLNPRRRRPVFGTVRPFTAGLYQRRGFHNPFQTRLGLIFEPEDERSGDGVILHGVSDIGLFARLLLALMTGMIVIVALVARHEKGADGPVWLVSGGMALGVGMVYAVGRSLAQAEHDFLVGFLVRTLDARPIAPPP